MCALYRGNEGPNTTLPNEIRSPFALRREPYAIITPIIVCYADETFHFFGLFWFQKTLSAVLLEGFCALKSGAPS
jgi:hypothetical protein